MANNRNTAKWVGIFILLAYSILGSGNPDARVMGMILEVVSGLAVITIALLMFPLLELYGEQLSLWYLTLKGIEGMLAIIAGIFFFIHADALLDMRDQIYQVHGYIFGISAGLFYYLLYKSKLIPQWLSIWGAMASALLVAVNLLELSNAIPRLEVLYLPIVLNEVVLAMWLILKGFDVPDAIRGKTIDP